jgi:fructose-specific phosphotransferase system IIA component
MELINEELILIDASFNDKKAVFENVCNLLDSEKRLLDKQLYLKDLYEREEMAETAPGYFFAIPHAKSKGVKTTSLVFISLKNEIDWTDTEKVKYIFAIAVPYGDPNEEHLNILSMLARKMMNEDFREVLRSSRTKHDFLKLLT